MNTITINYTQGKQTIGSEDFEFPEDFSELTLRQFIDWNELLIKEELSQIERGIELVSILTKKEQAEIEKLSKPTFQKLINAMAPLIEKGFPEVKSEDFEAPEGKMKFEIGDEVYFWEPDYFKDSIGNIAKMEQTLKGRDLLTHFHFILAFCCHKEDEVFDHTKLDSKANLFLDEITMDQIYQLLFFSLNGENSLTNYMQDFSLEIKKSLEKAALKRISSALTLDGMTFE